MLPLNDCLSYKRHMKLARLSRENVELLVKNVFDHVTFGGVLSLASQEAILFLCNKWEVCFGLCVCLFVFFLCFFV